MYHLFQHKNGKYDLCFIKNGNYVGGSPQGYDKKLPAIKMIFYMAGGKTMFDVIDFQDDTEDKAAMKKIFRTTDGKFKTVESGLKPKAKYIPNKK